MLIGSLGEHVLTKHTTFNPLALEQRHERSGAMRYADLEALI